MQFRALLALPFLVTSCNDKPDLSPIRDGLVKNAAVVCAPTPARPPHAPNVRDVPSAELTAALTALCTDAAPSSAAGVLHDALLADHANVGEARRSSTCNLDRGLLASATLDRCADVIALARDEDLTGNITDLLLANGQIQHAVEACLPIVEHASKDAAARFHTSLVILRTTFPTSIDDNIAREHAEGVLLHFGQVSSTLACPRATHLASAPEPPEAPAKLLAQWRASQEKAPDEPKVREAYTLTLGALDRLVSLADLVSRSSASTPAAAPPPRDGLAP